METHGGNSTTVTPQPFATSAAPNYAPPTAPAYVTPSASPHVVVGKGFVEKEIRRSNTRLLLINLLMLLTCIAVVVACLTDTSARDEVEWLPYVAGAFILLALWNLGQFVRRMFNPMAHPTLQSLAQYGPVSETIARINGEMVSPPEILGNAKLTANWIVRPGTFRLMCLPVERVAWIYKKVTQHYHNGIPTGKSYSVMIYAQDGQHLELNSKKKRVDGVVEAVGRRVPWAIIGHTPQIENFWNANRAELVAQVNKRRQEMMESVPTSGISG